MRPLSIAPAVLALAVTACSSAPGAVSPSSTSDEPGQPGHVAPTARPASSSEVADFAKSNNAFAVDVYAKLRAGKGNIAFSPASISTALDMTWAGAKGTTASQMQQVLHLGDDRDAALAAAKATVQTYSGSHDGYELAFADKLFGEKTYRFDQGFVSLSQDVFGAALEPVDFLKAPDAQRRSINAFVKGATHDRIVDLVPEGAVTAETRLVLVNAVYMKGKWQYAFDKGDTSLQAFATPDGPKDVQTMHNTANYRYADTGEVQILEMPYQGHDLAFTIVLPKDPGGLAAIEKKLDAQSLDRWLSGAQEQRVALSLPRFKVDTKDPLRLKPLLASLGMPLAFEDDADFTGMSDKDEGIKIDDAFHKAFVSLDEEGTEAAAATAVVMKIEGATAVEYTPRFVADHPFLFTVRDTRSGLVLFMGRVSDPSA